MDSGRGGGGFVYFKHCHFAWLPIVKTYSLAAIPVRRLCSCCSLLSSASPSWLVAVAGLLFGLSVDTRSYVVGLAPVFIWWIFRHSGTRNGIIRVLWFLGGFTIGLAPSIYLFASSPTRSFSIILDITLRSDEGLEFEILKCTLLESFCLGADNNGIQFGILSVMSFVATLVSRIRGAAVLLAFLIAFFLGLISILPTPTYGQYYSMCMPFLIVTAVCAASAYLASLRAVWSRRIAVFAGVAVLAVFVVSSVPSFRRYLFTGVGA